MSDAKIEISRHIFYQGLLLAACAEGAPQDFETDGRTFHDAFGSVIRHLIGLDGIFVRGLEHIQRDPVFSVYHEANELLLQAEYDLLLSSNLTGCQVHFKIDSDSAREELKEFEHADLLRDVGKVFADSLNARASQCLETETQNAHTVMASQCLETETLIWNL